MWRVCGGFGASGAGGGRGVLMVRDLRSWREGEGVGAAVGVGGGGGRLGRLAFRGRVWGAGGSADHGLFVFSVGVCGFEIWWFRV